MMVDDLESDIDFDATYQLYKVMSDSSHTAFAAFIKDNPKWIVVPLSTPKLQERFMPQDLANLYTVLTIWLEANCTAGWRIFLGCLVFESREDSNNFYTIWMMAKGTA